MASLSRRMGRYERPAYLAIAALITVGFFLSYQSFDSPRTGDVTKAAVIDGKPVTYVELQAMAGRGESQPGRVEVLSAFAAFEQSQLLASPWARQMWLEAVIRCREMRRRKGAEEPLRQDFVEYALRPVLSSVPDLTREDARERAAANWIAYLRAADRAGVRVTADEIRRFITSIAGYATRTREGEPFPLERYQQLVESRYGLDMPLPLFEQAVEEYLRVRRYFDAVGDAAVVSEADILARYREQNREASVAFARFAPEAWAAAAPAPTRDAVARYFDARRGDFQLPAKAQVEYLLAANDDFLAAIPAPADAEIKTRYENRKDMDYRKPPPPVPPGAEPPAVPPPPEYKPLDEVRDAIVKDLRLERARIKAEEALRNVLLAVGEIEMKMRRDPSVRLDFAKIAAENHLVRGETPFFDAGQTEETAKLFGAIREPSERESFRRRVFDELKPGEVMPGTPVRTEKGYVVYRLAARRDARVPSQLTAEVETEIVRGLRRKAAEDAARDAAQKLVDAINAQGLEKAEAALPRPLHHPPPFKAAGGVSDPDVPFQDGQALVRAAFEAARSGGLGRAQILNAGERGAVYVVVPLRIAEADLGAYDLQKGSIREELLDNRWDGQTFIPGKRQQLIQAERERLEKQVQMERKKTPEGDRGGERRPGV